MAAPSVTYTFTNATTADAGEINTNFQNLINSLTDGTGDLAIATLSLSGAFTANGHVTLGNGTTDDITITGSLASTINIKTTESYNIGSATKGLAGIYFGGNSQTVRLIASASASATYTMTLPVAAGTKGQVMQNAGSGVLAFVPGQTDMKNIGDADYTILDDDGYRTIYAGSTISATRIVTLPTASANTDRIITVKKSDVGAFKITVDGEGAETIDGVATWDLMDRYDFISVQSDGSNWHIIDSAVFPTSLVIADTGNGYGSAAGTASENIKIFTNSAVTGLAITYATSADLGDSFTINKAGEYSITYNDQASSGSDEMGISVNASVAERSLLPRQIASERILAIQETSGASLNSFLSVTAMFAAGDVVRAHNSPNIDGSGDYRSRFVIRHVG